MANDQVANLNSQIRHKIVDLFPTIVSDVDPKGRVLDYLIAKRVVQPEFCRRLTETNTVREERARSLLLELLSTSNPTSFIELRNALGECGYQWIVDDIDVGLARTENQPKTVQISEGSQSLSRAKEPPPPKSPKPTSSSLLKSDQSDAAETKIKTLQEQLDKEKREKSAAMEKSTEQVRVMSGLRLEWETKIKTLQEQLEKEQREKSAAMEQSTEQLRVMRLEMKTKNKQHEEELERNKVLEKSLQTVRLKCHLLEDENRQLRDQVESQKNTLQTNAVKIQAAVSAEEELRALRLRVEEATIARDQLRQIIDDAEHRENVVNQALMDEKLTVARLMSQISESVGSPTTSCVGTSKRPSSLPADVPLGDAILDADGGQQVPEVYANRSEWEAAPPTAESIVQNVSSPQKLYENLSQQVSNPEGANGQQPQSEEEEYYDDIENFYLTPVLPTSSVYCTLTPVPGNDDKADRVRNVTNPNTSSKPKPPAVKKQSTIITDEEKQAVAGLARLSSRLYVVFEKNPKIQVFDLAPAMKYKKLSSIRIDTESAPFLPILKKRRSELFNPCGMTSSVLPVSEIYVSNSTDCCVHVVPIVECNGKVGTQRCIQVDGAPSGVSLIATSGHLLVCFPRLGCLRQYDPHDGRTILQIALPKEAIHPWLGIALSEQNLIVCHGETQKAGKHQVLLIDRRRNCVIGIHGNQPGNGLDQLHQPVSMLVDSAGRVLIADCFNHRVKVLKSVLKPYVDEDKLLDLPVDGVLLAANDDVECPVYFDLDAPAGLLYVGQLNGRVAVYNIRRPARKQP